MNNVSNTKAMAACWGAGEFCVALSEPLVNVIQQPRQSLDKGFLGRFELGKDLFDRDSATDQVPIDAATNFFALMVVNTQHRIAAVALVETIRLFEVSQGVNKQGHEIS